MKYRERNKVGRRHSGQAPFLALLMACAVGIIAVIPTAIIYAAGDIYIPLVYARILLCIGLGFMIGVVPGRIMRIGKVRNNLIAFLVVSITVYFTPHFFFRLPIYHTYLFRK